MIVVLALLAALPAYYAQSHATMYYKLNKDGIKRAVNNGDEIVSASFKFVRVERFFVEAKTDKEI